MMMKALTKRLKGKKGFTLIEMIVVVAIIAILIAILVPNVMKFVDTARSATKEANAKTIYTAAQAYCTDRYTNNNPVGSGTWGADNAETYLGSYVSDPAIFDKPMTIVFKDGSVESAEVDGTKYPKTTTP